jgi:hypothetical protein
MYGNVGSFTISKGTFYFDEPELGHFWYWYRSNPRPYLESKRCHASRLSARGAAET